MSSPFSFFGYKPNPNRNRTFPPLQPKDIYKNSQWVVLNRKHAELMVKDDSVIQMMSKPIDNEHYPSTFLNVRGLLKEVIPEDQTFCLWLDEDPNHPKTFKNLKTDPHMHVLIKAIKDKMLFARKFAQSCDLSSLKKHLAFLKGYIF